MPVFPEDHVDENFFELWYHPYKKQIWGIGAAVTLAVVGYLAFREIRTGRLDDQWTRYNDSLQVDEVAFPGQADPDKARQQLDGLQRLIRDYPRDAVTPFALMGVANAYGALGQYDDAIQTLDELQSKFPEFVTNTQSATPSDTTSLTQLLRKKLESEREWTRETTYVHPTPSQSRIACIDTTEGSIWIGFYDELAPEHVRGFIERAKRGDYNRTQVYEVRAANNGADPQLIRLGSLASKTERNPALHDREELNDTIEAEDARYLVHNWRGVVASVETGTGESATNFQIVTAPVSMERYDGVVTPFAMVLDREGSMATLDKLGRAPTYGTSPETQNEQGVLRMRDHPYPPIYIRRVTIFKDEKAEDGHAFDTTRSGTDEPEPWEADLPPAPKPSEFVEAPATPSTDETKPGAPSTDTPAPSKDDDSDDAPADDQPDDSK